jgi:hypothetical protein
VAIAAPDAAEGAPSGEPMPDTIRDLGRTLVGRHASMDQQRSTLPRRKGT